MNKYIGIGRAVDDKWYMITLFLYNRMIKIALYTPRHKKPKYYYYNKDQFDFCINQSRLIVIKWFLGVAINCL